MGVLLSARCSNGSSRAQREARRWLPSGPAFCGLSQANHPPRAVAHSQTCRETATTWALFPCISTVDLRRIAFGDFCCICILTPSTVVIMASAVTPSVVDAAAAAEQALRTASASPEAAQVASKSTFGLLGRVILSILGVLPGVLFWASYTLPTWLFTLFSTTLTFTMNFSSLYAPLSSIPLMCA